MEQLFNTKPEQARISHLIAALHYLIELHGDLPVTYEPMRGGVQFSPKTNLPYEIRHIKIKERSERNISYWHNFHGEALRGEKVLKIG